MSDEEKSTTVETQGNIVEKPNMSTRSTWVPPVVLAIIVVIVIVVSLYVWFRPGADTFAAGVKQERSDTLADYNLHEAVRRLKALQASVTSKLSDDTGI